MLECRSSKDLLYNLYKAIPCVKTPNNAIRFHKLSRFAQYIGGDSDNGLALCEGGIRMNLKLMIAPMLGISFVALSLNACSKPAATTKKALAEKPGAGDDDFNPEDTKDQSAGDGTGRIESKPCWDKFLETPEVKACTTLYTYTGKSCVPSTFEPSKLTVKKEATCTLDALRAAYPDNAKETAGVAALVADGFEMNQCIRDSNNRLYVYLIKKKFKSGTGTEPDSYKFEDRKFGPSSGVSAEVFNSIILSTTSEAAQISCE